jgi:hypothetical protein
VFQLANSFGQGYSLEEEGIITIKVVEVGKKSTLKGVK